MNYESFELPRKARNKVEMTTTFKYNDTVRRVAKFEVQELKRATRFATNVEIPTPHDMERYLMTLLWLRIEWVNDQLRGEWKGSYGRFRCPARWFTLLSNIGEAHDMGRNFKFKPNLVLPLPIEGEEPFVLMTKEELVDMTDTLEYLLPEGYPTVLGLPRDKKGSLELMAKTTIQETIMGMDEHNPVYAFLGYILQVDIAADSYDNIELLFRTTYSSYDVYDTGFTSYFPQVSNDSSSTQHRQSQTQTNLGSQPHDGKGPAQPAPGSPPPNLGHEGNGAINSNGNLKGND